MAFLLHHRRNQNLIKQLKPRYNVLLRDDKSFPNILVSKEHPFPQIKKHRGAIRRKLNLKTSRELLAYAIERGSPPPSER